jgi:hypothetical protein
MRSTKLETPGTLAIMLVYLGLFAAMWLVSFLYLSFRWAIS